MTTVNNMHKLNKCLQLIIQSKAHDYSNYMIQSNYKHMTTFQWDEHKTTVNNPG